MYDSSTKEKEKIGLHDCRTDHMHYENGFLTVKFPGGFYYLDRPEPLRTGPAEMRCHIIDRDLDFYVFKDTKHGTVREDRSDTFCDDISSGVFEFECVTTYYAYRRMLIKGYVCLRKAPYFEECEIGLSFDDITFMWNENR